MMPVTILFLTTHPVEEASHGNQEIVNELLTRSITACLLPWRNSTLTVSDICQYTHVIFITCGHYIDYIEDFHKFIETVLLPAETLKPSLRFINHPSIVLWNSNKTYLYDLENSGFPIPRTQFLDALQSLDSLKLAIVNHAAHGPVVVKPSVSASGVSTHLIKDPSNLNASDKAFLLDIIRKPCKGSIILQDYVPEIKLGEYSLVFINGSMISAFLKIPAGNEFRVQEEYGGCTKRIHKSAVPDNAIKTGGMVWTYLTARFPDKELVYARIDGVVKQDGSFVLIEIELIEPSLYLEVDDDGRNCLDIICDAILSS